MKLSTLCFISFFTLAFVVEMIEGRKVLGHGHGSALNPNRRTLVAASEQCKSMRADYIDCCGDDNYVCDPCFDSGDGTHSSECSDTCAVCPAAGGFGDCVTQTEETIFDDGDKFVSYSVCICLTPSDLYGCVTEERNADGTGYTCSASVNGEACQCTICEEDPASASNWLVDCSAVMPDAVYDECNDVYTGFFTALVEADVANCTADKTCTQASSDTSAGEKRFKVSVALLVILNTLLFWSVGNRM